MDVTDVNRLHRAWLREIQPYGVTLSAPALTEAGVVPRTEVREVQEQLLASCDDAPRESRTLSIEGLIELLTETLRWPLTRLAGAPGGPELDAAWRLRLPELRNETLSPDWMLFDEIDGQRQPLIAVSLLAAGTALDAVPPGVAKGVWNPPPEDRFERYLRESRVPAGLLFNGQVLRLAVAPAGETSGRLDFVVGDLTEVMGRPLLGALLAVLDVTRLLTGPVEGRLPAILARSREFQSQVSTQLAEQVYAALWELVRGFEAAEAGPDRGPLSRLLDDAERADEGYHGLLAVLLRVVFVLFAEERGLISDHEVYVRNYSISALWERLRADHARYPDTMEQRFGAWAQLLALFRMLYEGGKHGEFVLAERQGRLFEPARWPFLEGADTTGQSVGARRLPRVSDGVVLRVLDHLMMLDGDRLQYRGLDVEQIGSVYESVMGYELRRANVASIALKPHHAVVELDELLELGPKERLKKLKEEAGLDLTGKTADAVRRARSEVELTAALESRRSPHTPGLIPPRGLFLQPTEERRRSGSHYTPRTLTTPIVEKTLAPVLKALGDSPRPDQILGLNVCDPAMGSGAFLVQTCRHLGAKLVDAWRAHGGMPKTVRDDRGALEEAQRLVASRCLYGVDKNPLAVDLAKLSLWLVTLSKDQPFTFVDHALRPGDSLLGLTLEQLRCLNWEVGQQVPTVRKAIDDALREARGLRDAIERLDDRTQRAAKVTLLAEADAATDRLRLLGDLVVASFLRGKSERDRQANRRPWELLAPHLLNPNQDVDAADDYVAPLRDGPKAAPPFHWPLEFPEVFESDRHGFDAFVGNPPFAGKNTLIKGTPDGYVDWLLRQNPGSHGNADLVAHFFRRAYDMLPRGGCLGFIATNTIAQGDTRNSGLQWIREHGGVLYNVQRRYQWPGRAAVVVSVICLGRELDLQDAILDGRAVTQPISAYLVPGGKDQPPAVLRANTGKVFQGVIILGMGFTFDDSSDEASPIALMHELIRKDPRNQGRIFPYLGGEELNTHPAQQHHRYVINFGEMSESEARDYSDLMGIVEAKVKPERLRQVDKIGQTYWWRYLRSRPELSQLLRDSGGIVLANSQVSTHNTFEFVVSNVVFSNTLNLFAGASSFSAFAVLQSRVHEVWARAGGSTLKDDPRYSITDCFETFPFPQEGPVNLDEIGESYRTRRRDMMAQRHRGLTDTYNRFHDPNELDSDIVELRRLHDAMDRAVLDAYGWDDFRPVPVFEREFGDEGRWRYRWPEPDRDAVFARLLLLNEERAREENAAAATAAETATKSDAPRKRRKSATDEPSLPHLGKSE